MAVALEAGVAAALEAVAPVGLCAALEALAAALGAVLGVEFWIFWLILERILEARVLFISVSPD